MSTSGDAIIWTPGVTLEQIERQVIEKAFSHFQKNKTSTAHALGIAIRTLDSKFERYAEQDKSMTVFEEERKRERAYQLARARGQSPAQYGYDTGSMPRIPQAAAVVNQAETRVHVESAANSKAQPEVPMPKREEVQELLPKQAAASGHSKRR